MHRGIWLIGGTSDSATIASILAESNLPFVVTVATASARNLYPDMQVIPGCMNKTAMLDFCQQHQIVAVIDASHPYAAEVSRQAIAAAAELNIPYLRYERASFSSSKDKNDPSLVELDSFEDLIAGDYLTSQRVLLTVGCKALSLFQSWHNRATLFARVLPKIASLETAIASGFKRDRLIAIRPPISIEMEMALWQQWQISLVVTKASGKAGGEDVKRQVAASLGISLIAIARPQIVYPQQTSDITTVLNFCKDKEMLYY